MMTKEIIDLKGGIEFIKNGIAKFIYLQENFPEQNLSASEFMQIYTHIYGLCFTFTYDQQVYNLYRQIIEEYVKETVFPCLMEKHGEILLSELVKRWKNYKAFVGFMSRLFHYLDRYFIPRHQLISLDEVGFTCFRNAVFQDIINIKARDSVIYLIEQERQGAQIDRVLLKSIVDYFFEVGGKQGLEGWNYYQKHYEEVILNSTASSYLGKAMSWISEEEDYYIEKAKECLAKEEENVSHYLHSCSKDKLLNTVQQQFLLVYEKHQLHKVKVEDISKKLSSSCMI